MTALILLGCVRDPCDGLDNDVDGEIDEAPGVSRYLWYADQDDDGFGDPETETIACAAPPGMIRRARDCDDLDGGVHPDSDEICGGGDEDCDGEVDEAGAIDAPSWYPDEDGDGFGAEEGAPACETPSGWIGVSGDCDDSRADVGPELDEVCDDGVDNDCDGTANDCPLVGERSLGEADVVFSVAGSAAGQAVAWAPDLDGDGGADLLIAAPDDGVAYLLSGSVDGPSDEGDALAALGGSAGELGGYGAGVAGVRSPAGVTLAVGGTGTVYLYSGDERGAVGPGSALAAIDADSDSSGLGWAIAAVLDAGDDGEDRLLIGTDLQSSRAWLIGADLVGDASVDEVGVRAGWPGSGCGGSAVGSWGDADGDGMADVVIGDICGSGGAGEVLAWLGPLDSLGGGDADVTLVGAADDDALGWSASGVGDVDCDGLDDLVVTPAYGRSAVAWLVSGDHRGVGGVDEASIASVVATEAVWSVAERIGDLDGDGCADLGLGVPGEGYGTVGVWYGPVTGSVEVGEADVVLTGASYRDEAGKSFAGAADADANGQLDLLIGSGASKAFVVRTHGL